MKNNLAVIILAAGKGSRMNSTFSKVLHEIGGRPMILKTVETLEQLVPSQIVAVVGFDSEGVKKALGNRVDYAHQKEQLGTGDAARVGLEKIKDEIGIVVVLNGDDSAFYKSKTIEKVIEAHNASENVLTFVTLEPQDPTGLGRVVRKNGKVQKIVEGKEATSEELKIKEVNDGLYVFDKKWLQQKIGQIEKSKVTGEYYLVDLIKLAIESKDKVGTYELEDPTEWHGVNTVEELNSAQKRFPKRIHIMGIAGAGAAAVAGIAASSGYEVTGCDLNPDSPYLENPQKSQRVYLTHIGSGIASHIGRIEKGHSKDHTKDIDLLVISPAVEKMDPKNEELIAAKEKNILVMTWQEFQGKFLQKDKFVITVAGAYGKSTTTAMVSQILIDSGLDPTCEVGAKVLGWETNFKAGNSKYYVCEADEYNDNFLNYHPDIAVILNVAWDHPDFFKTKDQLLSSYQKFITNIQSSGTLITTDQVLDILFFERAKRVEKSKRESSRQVYTERSRSARTIISNRPDIKLVKVQDFGKMDLQLIGEFRKLNANAALTAAQILGIDINSAKESLAKFKGVGRRLEYKGEIEKVKFYDDYAVQPYTILKTADALKQKFPNQKVTLVLEPHTFSRIDTFFEDFVKSLKETNVDQIYVCDVFAARENGDNKGLSQELAKAVGTKAKYMGSLEQTAQYLAKHLKGFDVVCSMGAGDSYKLYNTVSENLAGRGSSLAKALLV